MTHKGVRYGGATYHVEHFFSAAFVRNQQASEQAGQLQEIDERTRFARDEAKRRKAQAKRERQERGGAVGG